MALIRDDDAERQARIDQMVSDLDAARLAGLSRRAALIARALASLKAIPPKPQLPK
jgi:hypothetical protein